MFSSLWKSSSGEDEEPIKDYSQQLKKLTTCFPIGSKINYYPEYLDDISFETIILGYEINGKALYQRDHVRALNDVNVEFFLEEYDETLNASDLASFTLIVPDTSDLEKTLDYNSKAVIGRAGQFVRGKSITLVSAATVEGTPIVDTTVLRRFQVKQGFYQDYKVVSLEPRLESLMNKELRKRDRIELSLPCTLFTHEDNQSGRCATLIDCSELCVGIALQQVQADDASLSSGVAVRLCLPMPRLDKTFELTGEIYAFRPNGTVVVNLQRIKKLDKFEDLQLVDRLELRASLVQCYQKNKAG